MSDLDMLIYFVELLSGLILEIEVAGGRWWDGGSEWGLGIPTGNHPAGMAEYLHVTFPTLNCDNCGSRMNLMTFVSDWV